MTDDRSLDRAARSWLEEGPTRAPEQPVAAALARIQTTRQERDLRIPWRFGTMTMPFRVATIAVIGVLALGGAAMIANRFDPPSPGAEPTLTPEPSAAATPGFVGSGPLAPGPYRVTTVSGVNATFTIPAGWKGPPATGFAVLKEGAVILSFWQPVNVYSDPCSSGSLPNPSVGPTVDDLVAALAAQPFTETTEPTPVSVDGFSGQRIDYDVDVDAASCTGELWLWRDADGGDRTEREDQLNELWILDVAGSRIVINLTYSAETSAADRAELQRVFDTITIEP